MVDIDGPKYDLTKNPVDHLLNLLSVLVLYIVPGYIVPGYRLVGTSWS